MTDASELIGAVIETRVVDANVGDSDCQILQVNRRYDNDGEDLLGQGYFILEVAVEQIVYVTAPDSLSEEDVTSLVVKGFSRGSGGRVRFRRLLQAHPAFKTVLNIEVLRGSALSPPQAAPTSAPTASPTIGPSPAPTMSPSMTPSMEPSRVPSFHPSMAPSGVPTVGINPTSLPTLSPVDTSTLPTSAPSLRPTRAPTVSNRPPGASTEDSKDRDRQPLILGAIAGGIATILVSCFFIFCVWFPFCRKEDDEEVARQTQQQQQGARQRYSANSSASGQHHIPAMMIPGMVQLDEDHQSVADTSIGDGTAGGAFRTRLTVTNIAAPIKAPPLLKTSDGIQTLDSFDESSLYTSTTSQVGGGGAPLKPNITAYNSGPIDVDALDDDADDDDDEEEEYEMTAQSLLGDFVDDDEVSEPYPFFGIKKGPSPVGKKVMQSRMKDNSSPRDTKGFDPFEDRSALGSTLGSSTLPSAIGSTVGSALESTLDAASSSCSSSSRDEEEGKTSQSAAESDYQFSEIVVDSPPRPRTRAENNSLLRAVLEDARLLSQKSKSPSSKSRLSRKSAPARVLPRRSQKASHPHDLLADNYELEEALSVGAFPVTPPRGHGKSLAKRAVDQNNRMHATLRDLVYGSRATRESDHNGAVMKEELPSSEGQDVLEVIGAQPRHKWLSLSEEKASDADTPASSPGVLGINEVPKMLDETSPGSAGITNHWLLDSIEQTLDPRTLNGDAESINGKSFQSSRSRNSYGSRRSQKSTAHRGYENDLDRYLSKSPASAPSTSPLINGENNDGVDEIEPRTLEHDLKRLEMELAEVLQPDNDQATTTSSFTASSAGASRSTRSSRMTAKRSRRKRIVVVVPAGKLGIVLADRYDGKGTIVSEVRSSSAMSGMISPGDKLGEYCMESPHLFSFILLPWRTEISYT